MERDFITIREFCVYHKTEPSFLEALAENGLLTVIEVDREPAISNDALPDLECYVRWHNDLDINLEGIDAMRHLLEKLKALQQELYDLKSRLPKEE